METRLRVKTSSLELEFEGSQAFLKQELLDVLETLLSQDPNGAFARASVTTGNNGGTRGRPEMSTGSIAARLSVQSGSDLILAACAHLTFVGAQDVFSRREITENMKTATAYYRATYVANQTKYLQGLVQRGKLIERSAGKYSLSAPARAELEGKVREP
jgi:hypothetical protein